MSVMIEPAPEESNTVVSRALRVRIRRESPLPLLRASLRIATPLPAYGISNNGLRAADPLARARLHAWRYPLLSGSDSGFAHVIKRGKSLDFAGVSAGRFAERVLAACVCAEREFASRKEPYQARLLNLPALHLHAVWLFRPRGKSRFLVLSDSYDQAQWMTRSEMIDLIKEQERHVERLQQSR